MAQQYRIFQGHETQKVEDVTGRPANPHRFYYEPVHYQGHLLYSEAYCSFDAAVNAAEQERQKKAAKEAGELEHDDMTIVF